MNKCKFCKSKLKLILDLGKQPLAGVFLESLNTKEKFYPLRLFECRKCGLLQMIDKVPREELFQTFLSKYSLKKHFQNYAKEMVKRFLTKNSFIIEIGSNDGTLLKELKKYHIDVLGIEPVKHIADIANKQGLETIVDFFSYKLARKINRKADAIFANNVLAHIEDMGDVLKGINFLLKDNGILVFEVHHGFNILGSKQFDNIYHEHIYYYLIYPLSGLLLKHNFEIIEIKPIESHGGSIRVYAKKIPRINIQKIADDYKKEIITLLTNLKKQGKKIVGYGSSGRSNVILNYCDIDTRYIDYIIDESPTRYDKYTPGIHIPVVPPSKFDGADYIVILAWNYEREIRKKMKGFKGKWIIPFPEVRII